MSATVQVRLGARAYDIKVGAGALARAGAEIAALSPSRVAVVTDENVAALHLPALATSMTHAGLAHDTIVLPPGEQTKTFAQLGDLCARLLDLKLDRMGLVVALGGGVVGDLAGFAAAILKRGVGFVQIPTTLLAQVDSSVGGKTAVDMPQGKNLVGAFHQPLLVLADTAVLDTLPPRELRAGYAEVVKYGLLGDAAFFSWLERMGPAVLSGDASARTHAIVTSCTMKAGIVARDERETGERMLLNLGHTFGHALEAVLGFSETLLHGEAVAAGCVLAFRLSERLALCPPGAANRVAAHFAATGLPATLHGIAGLPRDPDALIAAMAQDKKAAGGRLRFILARGIGQAFVADDVPADAVRAVLADALG